MDDQEIRIVAFEQQDAEEFKAINIQWLNQYGLLEAPDLLVLNNPQGEIIDKGGAIFLAKCNGVVVGTAAIIKETFVQYELVKMGVLDGYKGRGISKMLIEACLQRAQLLGAKRVYLQSNSQLKTAIGLYERYGFKHIPVQDAHYLTADVMMELLL